MEVLRNLDLLSVGVTVAAIAILGFVVFLNNRKSITGFAFLLFSVVTILWGVVNYLNYQLFPVETALWLLKITIFLGAWHAFSFFQLAFVFPSEKLPLPKWYQFFLVPLVAVVSLLNLTPFVFERVTEISPDGRIIRIDNGPGIALFGLVVLGLVIGGIFLLIRKTIRATGVEKKQFFSVLVGVGLTFALLMIFNFILPAFFDNPKYIPLGALFIFPYIAFTAYAIFRHRLLNVRIIATEILTFVLTIAVLFEVIFSESMTVLILRSGIFLLVLGFGILLIRSVRKEVEQREKLEELTGQLTLAKMDLEQANVKLKELDKLKSEFLGFASHQVKSPMAVIKGFAELIADGSYGQVSEEAKAKAVKIKESTDRTIALVNNLLDLRKIEEGKMEFNFGQVDIAALLRGMVEEFQIVAKAKGLGLFFEASAPFLKIKADEQKIRQVLQNLLDNSIKYTERGFVKARIEEQGDYVMISVEDSGRGMSQDLIRKLFQRFVRDEQTKKEIQGTGLGLYIAKQIVTAHNGSIWAESDGEGKGSKFLVKLAKN